MGPRGGCCLWGVAVRSYYSPKAFELEARELALRPDGEMFFMGSGVLQVARGSASACLGPFSKNMQGAGPPMADVVGGGSPPAIMRAVPCA